MSWFLPGTFITCAGSSHFTFNISKSLKDSFAAIAADPSYHHYVIYRTTVDEHLEFVCRVTDQK